MARQNRKLAGSRRLDPVKLVIAKAEFENMERLGIIRRSSSPWSSPLHIVAKQGGGWRPCDNYCRLNDSTTPDRYPVPHIQDFSAHLAGKVIFSKVDLVRGYHQVPVHPLDIPKTAVITPFSLFKVLKMQHRLSSDRWIQYWGTYLFYLFIWMIYWWLVLLRRNTRLTYWYSLSDSISMAWL